MDVGGHESGESKNWCFFVGVINGRRIALTFGKFQRCNFLDKVYKCLISQEITLLLTNIFQKLSHFAAMLTLRKFPII